MLAGLQWEYPAYYVTLNSGKKIMDCFFFRFCLADSLFLADPLYSFLQGEFA